VKLNETALLFAVIVVICGNAFDQSMLKTTALIDWRKAGRREAGRKGGREGEEVGIVTVNEAVCQKR
jgi:hypothetical protein